VRTHGGWEIKTTPPHVSPLVSEDDDLPPPSKIFFSCQNRVFLWRVEGTRARTFFPSREGRERTRAGERCADNNKEETPADDPPGSGEQQTYFSVRYRQRHIL